MPNLNTVKDDLAKLVKRFESKQKGEWDEAATRKSLIDGFWESLGWDTDDPREVEVEKRTEIDEHLKRADYAFLEKGRAKFLVEAKQPSKNLTRNRDAIFQVKRYVFNTPDTNLGILHDFEEFIPYLVIKKPSYDLPLDGLQKKLIFSYEEYPDRVDELLEMFSRESVLGGSIEALLPKGAKLERVTETVNREFFADLMKWRLEIAKSIAKSNPKVSDHDINSAVNHLLNRILFLRVIEDRKIENYDPLDAAVTKWKKEELGPLFAYLIEVFKRLDPKYNGAIFAKHHVDSMLIDDKPLYDCIRNLYYPQSPYQFSEMPIEVIGNSYEQYLGSVLRTTPARQVKLEEKPEVRKAGGVYYTPKYIVDYIVEQTVGKLVEGKTPAQVSKLRILDPACGSGSFLIGAFERLQKYYIDYYTANPKKNKGYLRPDYEGNLKLDILVKKKILEENIYGVDIDSQAVDITEFSLYVKMLEGEENLPMFAETYLPELKENIKCGNSLIGWDILDMDILPTDPEERQAELERINPFDWEKNFPEIFSPHPKSGEGPHPKSFSQREKDFLPPSPSGRGVGGEGYSVPVDEGSYRYSQKYIIDLARDLRKKSNKPEEIMWYLLRDRNFHGLKFRRQHPIDRFIADFYCHELKLVIEIDGIIHDSEYQKEYDANRDDYITASGYYVLRVDANDVMNDCDSVLRRIEDEIIALSPHPRSFSQREKDFLPPSPSGRGVGGEGLSQAEKDFLPPSTSGRGTEGEGLSGGFDAVIGNPPYVRQEGLGEQKKYFSEKYESYAGTADLYTYFIERALKLLNDKGKFSYIVSNKWMRSNYGKALRKFLSNYNIEEIVDFGELPIFAEAATFPMIIVVNNAKKSKTAYAPIKRLDFDSLANEKQRVGYILEETAMEEKGYTLVRAETQAILEKIKSRGVPLGDYVEGKIYRGILTGFNKAFIIDRAKCDELIAEDPKSVEIIKPFVVGDDVRKYRINFRERYLILTKIDVDIKRYPAIFKHLSQYQNRLEKRWDKGKHWWELRACSYYDEFEKPKIHIPAFALESRFAYEEDKYVSLAPAYFIPSVDKYLLAIMNSKITWFWLRRITPVLGDEEKRGRLIIRMVYFKNIPIRTIDFDNPEDVALHDRMVSLVEDMLALNKRLHETESPSTRKSIEAQIAHADRKIDELVYDLYGLTDEEIAIVEESAK